MTEPVAGTLLPAAVCAVLLTVAWRPWSAARPPAGARWPRALTMLGFAAALLAAYAPINGAWPPFPPIKGEDWLPWLIIAATPIALLDLLLRPSTHQRWSNLRPA